VRCEEGSDSSPPTLQLSNKVPARGLTLLLLWEAATPWQARDSSPFQTRFDTFVVLRIDRAEGFYIPKRCLGDDRAAEAVRDFIEARHG
jgi:hypothetical protein